MKLHQITEDDLAALEQLCPEVADMCMAIMNNAMRIKLRRIQGILSNVRWNYGPPTNIETIEGGTDDER